MPTDVPFARRSPIDKWTTWSIKLTRSQAAVASRILPALRAALSCELQNRGLVPLTMGVIALLKGWQ